MVETTLAKRALARARAVEPGVAGGRGDFARRGLARRPNANDSLAAALGQEIIAGLYPPGSRLPAEARLLERFAVSRPTLREAFRALEAKGLIVSRQKVGTLVRPRLDWHMLDSDVLAWRWRAAPTQEFVNEIFQLRQIF